VNFVAVEPGKNATWSYCASLAMLDPMIDE
jgi:hypothetical protein